MRLGDSTHTHVVKQVSPPYDYRVFWADCAPFNARAQGGTLRVTHTTRDSSEQHDLANIVAAAVHRLLSR